MLKTFMSPGSTSPRTEPARPVPQPAIPPRATEAAEPVREQAATSAVPSPRDEGSKLIVGPNIKLKGSEITDCEILVAKAGLVGLTKSLARELAPEVRVNGIAPGPILWPEDDANFDEVSRQRIVSHTMLKRAGDPNDIALAVRFFAMESGFVTGQILAVDGGRSAKL